MYPNSSRIKLSKGWLKEWFPWWQLKDYAFNRLRAINKKTLHYRMREIAD